MSDQPVETLDDAEPSEAPRPVFIVIGVLAIAALAAELYVGVTSAFAPAISTPVATAPATPATTQTATPTTPPATPNLPVQVPPAGG
ncbi:MAG TPA: hypothetical protein VGO52_03525 [Hyphomonadaceae bacterium]|nr:hypothetical protein [Hyphomonadaceae bacterium]